MSSVDQIVLEARDENLDASLVLRFIKASFVWLLLGMLAGTVDAIRLVSPSLAELWGNISWLNYGRLRMFHTNAVIFGWLSNGFFAFTYYALPRLTKGPVLGAKFLNTNFWLVQFALLVGAFGLLGGYAKSVEYAEIPWWAAIIFALAFVVTVITVVGTILKNMRGPMYVSLWYLLLGFVFTTMNYVMAHTVVTYIAPGAAGAALEGLWIHNAVGLWVTPIGNAIVYYLLPVMVQKPIASHRLSLIGFWTLALFYPLGGSHHYFFSPVPWWLQVIAVPLTAALIFVVYTVVYNFFKTMSGNWKRMTSDVGLRFLTFGIFSYIITCTQGPFHALFSVQKVIHFTDWVVAHAHLALFGVFSWWLFAFIYFVWPRLTGRVLRRDLSEWHFWLSFIGFYLLYYIPDTIAGLMQGFAWLSGLPLIDSLVAAQPFWVPRAISGVVLMLGVILFVWNLYTSRIVAEVNDAPY